MRSAKPTSSPNKCAEREIWSIREGSATATLRSGLKNSIGSCNFS